MGGRSTPLWLSLGLQCILCLDCLRMVYFKDPKGYCWAFGIAALEMVEIKQPSALPHLLEDTFGVGQRTTGAIRTAHWQQYPTNQDTLIPSISWCVKWRAKELSAEFTRSRTVQHGQCRLTADSWPEWSCASSESGCARPAGTSIQEYGVLGSQAVHHNTHLLNHGLI